MKAIYRIFLLFSLISVISCNGRNKNTAGIEMPQSRNITEDTINMDTLYAEMTVVELPFNYSEEFISNLADYQADYLRLPQKMYTLFPNNKEFSADVHIAKLPQTDNFRPIIAYYQDSLRHTAVDMYTLSHISHGTQVLDRLQLYSIEKPQGHNYEITRKYEVLPDYKIRVYKDLDGKEIESLYYNISDEGNFVEIRDGKTPATAFESFDNMTYYVETFVWRVNSNGGLEKTNVRKKEYRVNKNGKLQETTGNQSAN